jgi:hypothetical protein
LTRHYARTDVYDSINKLIDEDFLLESSGVLRLADPVFAGWLNVEPDRRDPPHERREPAGPTASPELVRGAAL